MRSFDNVKRQLNLNDLQLQQLEEHFKSSVEHALQNFRNRAEAEMVVKRSEQTLLIDRRVSFLDFNNGRGGAPVTYWKKECRYCRAVFETTNRRAAFCQAPGHRQRFYERKKSAKLFLYLMDKLEDTNTTLP